MGERAKSPVLSPMARGRSDRVPPPRRAPHPTVSSLAPGTQPTTLQPLQKRNGWRGWDFEQPGFAEPQKAQGCSRIPQAKAGFCSHGNLPPSLRGVLTPCSRSQPNNWDSKAQAERDPRLLDAAPTPEPSRGTPNSRRASLPRGCGTSPWGAGLVLPAPPLPSHLCS